MTPQQIIQAYFDGIYWPWQALAELEKLQVRGELTGRRFVGYDYRNQRWLELSAS